MKQFMKTAALLAVIFSASLFSGCVSEVVEPEHTPRLTVAQSSDGTVALSWKSEVGYKYRVVWLDPDKQEEGWKALEKADVVQGTGNVVTVYDKRNPRRALPWYNIEFWKNKK